MSYGGLLTTPFSAKELKTQWSVKQFPGYQKNSIKGKENQYTVI